MVIVGFCFIAIMLLIAFLARNQSAMNAWGATPSEERGKGAAVAVYAVTIDGAAETVRETFYESLSQAEDTLGEIIPIGANRCRLLRYRFLRVPRRGEKLRRLKQAFFRSVIYDALCLYKNRKELRAMELVPRFHAKN